MNLDPTTMQAAQPHLYDYESEKLAPMVTWGGLLLLQDSEPLICSLAQRQTDGDITRWRVLWTTATRVIYAEASKHLEDWDAYTPDQEGGADADTLTSWCRPITDAVRLELVEQTTERERFYSENRTWNTSARLVLRDGPSVDLPLFGGQPTYRSREAVDAAVSALVRQLWRSR